REGQCEERSVRAMDGAADLQGCVYPSRSDWPSLSVAPSIQQQVHPSNSNQRTQTNSSHQPPTHKQKRAQGLNLMLSSFSGKKKKLAFRLL
ncbi:hypothetical protein, partial [Pantoea rodasii]|uniref:hypothetical protein n=1 Tax=Pantoea rodasii TaxID=1076549 RepID=UPI001B80A9B9